VSQTAWWLQCSGEQAQGENVLVRVLSIIQKHKEFEAVYVFNGIEYLDL